MYKGFTYVFNSSDSTNYDGGAFDLLLSTTNDGTHSGGTEYTSGVTKTGTAGTDRKLTFKVPQNAPATLYYYCHQQSGFANNATITIDVVSTGAQGVQGATGARGIDGILGGTGTTGPQGSQGATGYGLSTTAQEITGVKTFTNGIGVSGTCLL